jgi:hypothetical protein
MAETNHRKASEQKRQYWQAHDEACRKSGLTREAYCTQHNLNVKTFAYWRQRLKKGAVPVRLVQLPTAVQQQPTAVRLVVNGCSIEVAEGFNAQTLAAVVCVLRRL